MNWTPLTLPQQLELVLAESNDRPVLLFKHSTRCSISSTVLHRLERNWTSAKSGNTHAYLLDLLNFRTLSASITTITGVGHESPQAILIWQGEVIFQASHFDITFDKVMQALPASVLALQG
jgi:bacillithiol system protein YtxJ